MQGFIPFMLIMWFVHFNRNLYCFSYQSNKLEHLMKVSFNSDMKFDYLLSQLQVLLVEFGIVTRLSCFLCLSFAHSIIAGTYVYVPQTYIFTYVDAAEAKLNVFCICQKMKNNRVQEDIDFLNVFVSKIMIH